MKLRDTHVITFANQKGGCGKTTSAVSLAAAFAVAGYMVTLVDTDPQCNATDSFGIDRNLLSREGAYTLADVYLEKKSCREIEILFSDRFKAALSVVPGNRGLTSIGPRLDAQVHTLVADGEYSDLDMDDLRNEQRLRLKRSIDSLRGYRDIVIVDTPPDLGFFMTTALIASDWYVIPVFPSGYDLKGLETLVKTVEKIQQRFNPQLKLLGVLVGNFDASAKLDNDIYAMLRKKFGEEFLFRTAIRRTVKHRECTAYGHTIFEHTGAGAACEQYTAVMNEILAKLGEDVSSVVEQREVTHA
jgi:chromosome partitioning protein